MVSWSPRLQCNRIATALQKRCNFRVRLHCMLQLPGNSRGLRDPHITETRQAKENTHPIVAEVAKRLETHEGSTSPLGPAIPPYPSPQVFPRATPASWGSLGGRQIIAEKSVPPQIPMGVPGRPRIDTTCIEPEPHHNLTKIDPYATHALPSFN